MPPAPPRSPVRAGAAALSLLAALTLTGCTQWTATEGRPVSVASPAAPAPVRPASPSPTCPPSGLRLTADRGDAAMGLRVLGVHLTNCGRASFRLSGYPVLRLLDSGREDTGVGVLHGTDTITTAVGFTGRDSVVLARGESAKTVLAWRNTVTTGKPPTGVYIEVTPGDGLPPQRVRSEQPVDVGTAAVLGTTRWGPAPETTPAPDRPPLKAP